MEGKTLGTSGRREEKEGGPEVKEWGREGRVATKSEPPVQNVTPIKKLPAASEQRRRTIKEDSRIDVSYRTSPTNKKDY